MDRYITNTADTHLTVPEIFVQQIFFTVFYLLIQNYFEQYIMFEHDLFTQSVTTDVRSHARFTSIVNTRELHRIQTF